jgi:hypothetical protein
MLIKRLLRFELFLERHELFEISSELVCRWVSLSLLVRFSEKSFPLSKGLLKLLVIFFIGPLYRVVSFRDPVSVEPFNKPIFVSITLTKASYFWIRLSSSSIF